MLGSWCFPGAVAPFPSHPALLSYLLLIFPPSPPFLPAVLPFVSHPSFLVNSTGQVSQEVCAVFVFLV